MARHLYLILIPQLQALDFAISRVPVGPPFTSASCYNYILGMVGGLVERLAEEGLGDILLTDTLEAALFLVYGEQGLLVPDMSTMDERTADEAVCAHAFGWEEGRGHDPASPGKPTGFLLAAQGYRFSPSSDA